MEYISTKEAATKWGISTSRITLLANEGRIPGAYRLGKSWLIPASATKPEPLEASRPGTAKKVPDKFSFPLYHFRPDWSSVKESQLSKQQQILLQAETAVLECRFADAYPLLESILKIPDDIVSEIACLWNAGICCIALNKPDNYSKIDLQLQMLLSKDFPHRNDLVILRDVLRSYVETIDFAASHYTYSPDIHEQCIPLACILLGYAGLTKESLKPFSADTALLELNLRLLKTTGAVIAMEFMHCYLLGIYYMRQEIENAKKHAKAAVQIAFENKFYFPLVTYYRYYAQTFSPILEQYPQEFQKHCHECISQYEENFTSFLSSISEYAIFSRFTGEDYTYAHEVFMGLTNTRIAEKLGVSKQTVKRRIQKMCEKLDVNSKKELIEYLHNYM